MTSSEPRPSYARRIQWLALFVAFAILAYWAGWHYLAGRISGEIDATLARLAGDGIDASCTGRDMRGFPFRMGVFCDTVTIVDARSGATLSGAGLRTAAQVYDPARIVGELDGLRAETRLSNGSGTDTLGAAAIRFSARIDRPLPQRASVEASDVTLNADAGPSAPAAAAASMQAHMRRAGADLDIAARAEALSLELPGAAEAIDLAHVELDLTLTDGVALVTSSDPGLRGTAGMLRGLDIATGPDAGFSASGPIAIRDDGLIDAELTLSVRNPAAVSAFLAELFPEQRDTIESLFRGLSILGSQPSLPLVVKAGEARIGFVPVGRIPPVEG